MDHQQTAIAQQLQAAQAAQAASNAAAQTAQAAAAAAQATAQAAPLSPPPAPVGAQAAAKGDGIAMTCLKFTAQAAVAGMIGYAAACGVQYLVAKYKD